MTEMRHPAAAKGFTLIELLVAIAVIGILSSIVFASVNTARNKGFDAKRAADMEVVRTALEMYYGKNYAYPVTTTWSSQCAAWPDQGSGNVIPGLVPAYLPQMPVDPQMTASANTCCYLYYSNGADFKFLAHGCPTSYACYGSGEATGGYYDPTRPTWSCQVSSPGGVNW